MSMHSDSKKLWIYIGEARKTVQERYFLYWRGFRRSLMSEKNLAILCLYGGESPQYLDSPTQIL